MAIARHAELSENRRGLQRRNRPQILHPRRPRRRRPLKASTPRDATSIPASGLPPITPAGGSRASSADMPLARLPRPSGSTRGKPPKMPSSIAFLRPSGPTPARPGPNRPAKSAALISSSHQKSLPPSPPRLPTHWRRPPRIKNAILAANDAAMRYAATDLGFARKGHAGEEGADPGEVGWVTFVHAAAHPTLALQDEPTAPPISSSTIAGNPHYHSHNFLPNLCHQTARSAQSTPRSHRPTYPRIRAYFQAQLPSGSGLGVRIDYDAGNRPSSCRCS